MSFLSWIPSNRGAAARAIVGARAAQGRKQGFCAQQASSRNLDLVPPVQRAEPKQGWCASQSESNPSGARKEPCLSEFFARRVSDEAVSSVGARRVMRRLCVLTAATTTFLALAAPGASASVQILSFNAQPSTPQAGAHPDFMVEFSNSSHQSDPTPCACNDAKNINVHLPAGLIGNPHSTPQCEIAEFASDQCPVDSQIGVVEVVVGTDARSAHLEGAFVAPVYNIVPPPGEPGLLGFKSGLLDSPTFEVIGARTESDYGLNVDVTSIEHFFPPISLKQLTWGVPAAPSHNYLRFERGQESVVNALGAPTFLCDEHGDPSPPNPTSLSQFCPYYIQAAGRPYVAISGPVSSNSPLIPFTQNPTTCGLSSLQTSLDILAYDKGETHAESTWPATTDCEQLAFNPSQSIEPTTTAADSPSGAEFRLTVPQFESPEVPSPSELKAAVVTLPEGFSFAPNVTNGKTTCSEAQAKFGTTEEAECPEDAKIGTLSVETPVLPGPLPGAVYLGEPKPGNRFRLFLAFNGFGVHVKLAGTATPDPLTGQIHISFQNLPQVPFADFNMHIFGSERGPLDTPTQCGKYEVTSEWTPWDSALGNQISRQFFEVNEGPNGTRCPGGPRPFKPAFQAASASNIAALHTSFSINLTREDGEQNLKALNVTTPPGFAATLKGVSYCPEAAIAAAELESHTGFAEQANPSCPASSQVGEVIAGAGPGTHPLYLSGKVYLAGPYKGAPLSLVFITPAVSGGYDLGNVVIREGLRVNPETAQVSTAGAPLPQIFQGIPLRLRQILVNLNRKDFGLNPTNCNPLEVNAEVFGSEGAEFTATQHFQVANCASLSFAPKLSMAFTGSTKRAGTPGLRASIEYPQGGSYANIASTSVTLPPTELIDNAHLQDPCTKVQFAQGSTPGEKCPAGTVIGFAKAETPLLDKPLEGPVYLRSAPENKNGLPDLVATLDGQIDLTLDGKISTVDHGKSIRTTFATVPDAPVSHFTLSLDGDHKGLLQNSANLCARPLHVSADITGQNGKTANQNPLLQTPCAKHHKRARRSRTRRTSRGGNR